MFHFVLVKVLLLFLINRYECFDNKYFPLDCGNVYSNSLTLSAMEERIYGGRPSERTETPW
jgi:hypothetical protein